MPRYEPSAPPLDEEPTAKSVLEYVESEFRALASTLGQVDEGRRDVSTTEPARPRTGQVAYADGTVWNPGDGAGLYYYDGTEWVLMKASGTGTEKLHKFHFYGGW